MHSEDGDRVLIGHCVGITNATLGFDVHVMSNVAADSFDFSVSMAGAVTSQAISQKDSSMAAYIKKCIP